MKIKIITDSCCSLSIAELNRLGIDYVQMSILIDDQNFDAFDCPITDPEEYYKKIKTAKKVSTGCVNVQSFTDIFEKYAHQGWDVVYIGLSSGLSSTYDNAVRAASEVNKTCGKHIYVADSLSGSFAIAIMLEHAVKMAAEGKTAEQICKALDKNGLNTLVYFMPEDLQFLSRCGRLNKISATVGSMLKLAPVLAPNEEGKLKTVNKFIGRKKGIKNLGLMFLEGIDISREEKIYVGHTGAASEAEEIANFLKQNTQNKQIEVGYLDYTMGSSCGPCTVALFGIKK